MRWVIERVLLALLTLDALLAIALLALIVFG